MSVDPLAGGSSANVVALVEAELAALAADAATLRSILDVGDIVQARVLPSNGLTDLIDIAGQRVAAALPPTLRPGDSITVQVNGFDDQGRILVQIVPDAPSGADQPASESASALGARAAPSAPLLPAFLAPPPGPALGVPPVTNARRASAETAPNPLDAGPTSPPAPPSAGGAVPAPAVSPPIAVFVAASIRSTQPVDAAAPTPGPLAPGSLPEATQTPGVGAPLTRPLQPPLAPGAALGSIEARLAAARAATPPQMNGPPPAVAERIAPPAVNRPFVAPPLLLRPPISVRPPVPTGYQTVSGSAVPPPAPPPARGLALYAEPVALLRALRLPVTPTNVASARLALESPQRLQNALAILERALPSSIDPRVTTLRTLAGFLTRIEPQSPTLATQIASYVDHVLEGSEPKLAQLLVARDAVAQAQPRPPAGAEPNAAAPLPTYPSTQLAHAAERQAALQYDFKSTLLSLAQSPPPGGGEELATALGGVLAALTALQVNAATTLAANPNGLAIAIPIALPNGIAQAHVRVDRHAPEAKNVPLDGDNFHIAFVLETQHFGIVAIDLVTVGRTVTLGVKTEATLAARAFNGALGKLTERLEKLRYHVARADALVAAVGTTTVVETSLGKQQMGDPADPTKLVDRSA